MVAKVLGQRLRRAAAVEAKAGAMGQEEEDAQHRASTVTVVCTTDQKPCLMMAETGFGFEACCLVKSLNPLKVGLRWS